MQRTAILFACFFIYVNCFSQSPDPIAIGSSGLADPVAIWSSGQYPFVHYTPKDGLISNSIRSIYQDSKGRLYFTSINGLSVYDGSRFINYTSKNGLDNDIVNCVMEMGDDSLWIVTNLSKIQSLVNGKLKPVALKDPPPLIDNLIRDETGALYAASEQGLYLFKGNKFIKLPFLDMKGKDAGTFIANIYPVGKYLLVVRDNSLVKNEERYIVYLYDKDAESIIAQTQKEIIHFVAKAPDGRIWASTAKNILEIDPIELNKGKIVFRELPTPYENIRKSSLIFISFDQFGNCWLTDKVSVLKKVSPGGDEISFTTASGLSAMDINHVFQDKEETTWIASFEGISKLVHSNFTFFSDVFEVSQINSVSYSSEIDRMYLYSPHNAKAIAIGENSRFKVFEVMDANKFAQLIETPNGLFGFSRYAIYKLRTSGNSLYPQSIFVDTIDIGNPVIDKNGNIIFCGIRFLTAVLDAKNIYRRKITDFSDNAALDSNGNIWTAGRRTGEIIMYQPKADDPANYLEDKVVISKDLNGISPRSIIIDKNNTIWIGTRNDGIHVFKLENGNLIRQFSISKEKGLSDNFITHLACDAENNIWACSPSGLDKITLKNEIPVIENVTKQNNTYQKVFSVVIDKNNNAWSLLHNGFIKITPENKNPTGYSPMLMVSMIKAGNDTLTNAGGVTLSHKQNNLSFHFAATSFLDEKQILFSYRLLGSSNNPWSEPSNNTTVSFIDLPPGHYTLDIKASFPAGRYPEKIINYKFSIAPPWWQTWWLRSIAGLLIIGLLITGFRFYYKRKLEKQLAVLEKQQAIEKERTRIATDMHDDLGSGLTRIKFITEGMEEMTKDAALQPEMEKLKSSSNELVEKMAEIIWAMNEKNNTLEDLVFYLRSYAVDYCNENRLVCEFTIPENIPQKIIGGQIRRNVFLVLKESLHNIVKHAAAKNVKIGIIADATLSLTITDDGKGFVRAADNSGNGLMNMQQRAEALKGELMVSNKEGTTIRLEVPV